jgi:hypothetical protein
MADQSTSTTHRTTADRPTRGADRNRLLADRADPSTDGSLLPTLEAGVTLLDVEGGRGVATVQSLVLDHLLLHDGPAFWVDADGHATTTTLARIAPSRRLLDRIHVARGFTAAQHYGAVRALPAAVNRAVRHATAGGGTADRGEPPRDGDPSPPTPSLVVAPAVDARYRDDDAFGAGHAATLLARTLARAVAYADGYDVPVLLTRSERDEFAAPVARAADHHLTCERTRMGPRFVGDDFETLVYPGDDGAFQQTTFAYWRAVLGARATQFGLDPEPAVDGRGDVGTAATVDGERAPRTADPLLDAWATADAGGR